MKPFVAGLIAYLAAIAVPSLFVAALSQSFVAAALVSSFGALYALVVGIPIFLVLNRYRLVTWWWALASGFVAVAAFDVPAILNHWQYMAAQGYLGEMIKSAAIKGLYGAGGGFTFWFVWTRLMPPNPSIESGSPTALTHLKR
jgi:hypothetical protein